MLQNKVNLWENVLSKNKSTANEDSGPDQTSPPPDQPPNKETWWDAKANSIAEDVTKRLVSQTVKQVIDGKITEQIAGKENVEKARRIIQETGSHVDALAELGPGAEAGATEYAQDTAFVHLMSLAAVRSTQAAEEWLDKYKIPPYPNLRRAAIMNLYKEHLQRKNQETEAALSTATGDVLEQKAREAGRKVAELLPEMQASLAEKTQNVAWVHLMSSDKIRTIKEADDFLDRYHIPKYTEDGREHPRRAAIINLFNEHISRKNQETEDILAGAVGDVFQKQARQTTKRIAKAIAPYYVAAMLIHTGFLLAQRKALHKFSP